MKLIIHADFSMDNMGVDTEIANPLKEYCLENYCRPLLLEIYKMVSRKKIKVAEIKCEKLDLI